MVPPGVATADGPERPSSTAKGGPRSKGPWVIGAVVLVALGVVAVVVALNSHTASTTLGTGPATATIHIAVPRSGEPSFSGTVDGLALTGTVTDGTAATTNESSGTLSLSGVLFNYQGNLGGNPYILHVTIGSSISGLVPGGSFAFHVTGTFGSEPVTATAEFNLASSTSSPDAASEVVTFSGGIGKQSLIGNATVRRTGDGAFEVTARFTVLPSA
jgi:hypothetical protein